MLGGNVVSGAIPASWKHQFPLYGLIHAHVDRVGCRLQDYTSGQTTGALGPESELGSEARSRMLGLGPEPRPWSCTATLTPTSRHPFTTGTSICLFYRVVIFAHTHLISHPPAPRIPAPTRFPPPLKLSRSSSSHLYQF